MREDAASGTLDAPLRAPAAARGGALVLGLCLALVALSTLQLAWRLGLPTDGWQPDVGGADLVYARNVLGAASPLRPGDRLLEVGGQDLRGAELRVFGHRLRWPDGWRPGGRVTYRVDRGGQPLELEVPIHQWTAAVINREAFDALILQGILPAWLVALYVLSRRPADRSARLLLGTTSAGLASSISWIGSPGGLSELFAGPAATAAYLFFSHLMHPLLISPLMLLLVMGFPRPNGLLRRWPRLVPALVLLTPWLMLASILRPDLPSPFFPWVLACSLLQVGFLAWSLIRVRDPRERAPLRWFALGFAAEGLGTAASVLGFAGLQVPTLLLALPGGLLMSLGLAVAILRYQLFDIEVRLDRDRFEALARQAGLAASALRRSDELGRLNAELELARERLVSAREEERRRLRRDLHDGLGPTLASLTLRLDAARNLLARDPERADAQLVATSEQMQEAIAEIRRLVYDLRPPALDELGLAGALEQLALRQAGLQVSVEVEAPPLPALPAAVEVAAYRIVQEALANALRHGHAKDCRVQLALAAEGLRLQVSDDGQGLPNALEPGVGLRSMRERATELGGSLALERRAGGGTAVLACLPLGTGGAGAARNGSDGSPNGASPGRAEAPSGAAGR